MVRGETVIQLIMALILIVDFHSVRDQMISVPDLIEMPVESINYEKKELGGMVIPHHLVPLDKIIGMYEIAGREDVEHVIILSPDHFTNSSREVLTTARSFISDFGTIGNHAFTEDLLKLPFVYEDANEIQVEHGLYSHLPLIKRYFPNAKISVLAISKQTKRSHIDELLSMLPEDAFIIGSVDFSHYYPKEQADIFDDRTKHWIENKDYEIFFSLNDAYLDSPGILYILMSYAEKHNLNVNIMDQGNSQDYFKGPVYETTSYFFIGLER